jgi:hypothetical protein
MEDVNEEESVYQVGKSKSTNLVGAAHALWYAVTEYQAKNQAPKTHEIWRSLWDLNPSRTVWEWWFKAKAREAQELWREWELVSS